MSTLESYLRGVTSATALRKHMLTAAINEAGHVHIKIHPHGVSYTDELEFIVSGNNAFPTISKQEVLKGSTQFEKDFINAKNQLIDAWQLMNLAAIDGSPDKESLAKIRDHLDLTQALVDKYTA